MKTRNMKRKAPEEKRSGSFGLYRRISDSFENSRLPIYVSMFCKRLLMITINWLRNILVSI
jgi:hypothetical protein